MLIMRQPQFETQDDFGTGSGIPPIPEWQLDPLATHEDLWYLDEEHCTPMTRIVFMRLKSVFQHANSSSLPPTRLHDLASFVIHRLLSNGPNPQAVQPPPCSECIRYALVSYMFIIQGPTYYSHAVILQDIMTRLIFQLEQLEANHRAYDALHVWLYAIGLVASTGTADYTWFSNRAGTIAASMSLTGWEDVLSQIKNVMWLDVPHGEAMFRSHWDEVFGTAGWVEMEEDLG